MLMISAEWPFYIVQSAIVPGFMYLTDNHICFYASLPKSQVSRCLALHQSVSPLMILACFPQIWLFTTEKSRQDEEHFWTLLFWCERRCPGLVREFHRLLFAVGQDWSEIRYRCAPIHQEKVWISHSDNEQDMAFSGGYKCSCDRVVKPAYLERASATFDSLLW